MPTLSSVVAFAALSYALIVIPGSSVMFVVSRAVSLGRRAALLTVAGNASGVYVQVVLVALGLGVIVERSAVAFTVIKLVGAGYLVWLGVQAIYRRRELTTASDVADPVRPRRTVYVDGFMVGVANPKSIIFLTAILPQYVEAGGAPVGVQMALLGLVFVVIALVSDSRWALAAGTARLWFARSPRRLERLGAAGGIAMMGLGFKLAVSGRSD